jgi:hypothetical protein
MNNEEAISGEERPTEINNTKRGKLLVISFPHFMCDLFISLFIQLLTTTKRTVLPTVVGAKRN